MLLLFFSVLIAGVVITLFYLSVSSSPFTMPPTSHPSTSLSITATSISSSVDKYVINHASIPLTFRQFFDSLSTSRAFRLEFNAVLRNSRHTAFYFETPPFTAATLDRPFEFVLVDAPSFLSMRADGTPFESHLSPLRHTRTVAVFDNLGGIARLIAPAHAFGIPAQTYPHIAPFVRGAPEEQVDFLWRRVGEVAMELAGENSNHPEWRWLSTVGGLVILALGFVQIVP